MRSFAVGFYFAETWLLRRCHPRDEIGHLIESEATQCTDIGRIEGRTRRGSELVGEVLRGVGPGAVQSNR